MSNGVSHLLVFILSVVVLHFALVILHCNNTLMNVIVFFVSIALSAKLVKKE